MTLDRYYIGSSAHRKFADLDRKTSLFHSNTHDYSETTHISSQYNIYILQDLVYCF